MGHAVAHHISGSSRLSIGSRAVLWLLDELWWALDATAVIPIVVCQL
jgi:hypothetical protein